MFGYIDLARNFTTSYKRKVSLKAHWKNGIEIYIWFGSVAYIILCLDELMHFVEILITSNK
jgi:hypothetical protein